MAGIYVMDIPKNYKQHNIDKWVLKPAIKELTKPQNLLEQKSPFRILLTLK